MYEIAIILNKIKIISQFVKNLYAILTMFALYICLRRQLK